jgi:hypothetical protein
MHNGIALVVVIVIRPGGSLPLTWKSTSIKLVTGIEIFLQKARSI